MATQRSKEQWRQRIRDRMGGVGPSELPDAAMAGEVGDAQCQTTFAAETKEVAAATLVSTADLNAIIPRPDTDTLAMSTLSSLKEAEAEAAELLKHVQRDLAFYLREAGVSYNRSSLDELKIASRSIDDEGGGDAHEGARDRRQLQYRGGLDRAVAATPEKSRQDRLSDFALQSRNMTMYRPKLADQAAYLTQLDAQITARHAAFDQINDELAMQTEARRSCARSYEMRDGASALTQRYQPVAGPVAPAEGKYGQPLALTHAAMAPPPSYSFASSGPGAMPGPTPVRPTLLPAAGEMPSRLAM
jgi:hypothetical protein